MRQNGRQPFLRAASTATCEEVEGPEIHNAGRRIDLLYWSCFIVGCGVLIPWGSILSTVDYFKHTYPNRDAMRWITVIYLPASLLTILLNSFLPPKHLGHERVSIAFLVAGFAFFAIPIIDWLMIDDGRGTDLTFSLLMIPLVFLGAANGVMDAAFSGQAAYLPFHYYQAYLRGTGLSSLCSVVVRLMTKAAFTDSPDSLRLSACIFCIASSLFCWACLIIHRQIIVPHPIWLEVSRRDERQPFLRESCQDDSVSVSLWSRIVESPWMKTGKKIRIACLCMFLTMFAQLAIFPGILTDIECEALGSYYEVLLVLLDALACFIGTCLPNTWITKEKRRVLPSTVLRCLMIPLAFLIVHDFAHPLIVASMITILGVSRGYLLLCSFGMGQIDLNGREESIVGGSLLSLFLFLGLCIGSFAALAWMLFD